MQQHIQTTVVTHGGGPAPSMNMAADRRRCNLYQPGELITSVQLDQSALECFYCAQFFPCCCYKEKQAAATYMDIYANFVLFSKPIFTCGCCLFSCCSKSSMGTASHYDDPTVHGNTAVKGECCSPYPFFCLDCCGLCGEVLVLRGSCCSGVRNVAMGNQVTAPSWCCLISCCTPISIMYGLAPGEANRAASVLNNTVANFRNGRWAAEANVAPVIAGVNPQMHQPSVVIVNTSTSPGYAPPPPGYAPAPPVVMGEAVDDHYKSV